MQRKARQILQGGGTVIDGQVCQCEYDEGYWSVEFEITGRSVSIQANSIPIPHRPPQLVEGTRVKFLRDSTGQLFLL
ncbi:hypothetical protein H6G89_10860 [Oscillatoria sp. FACHB-1407]|uniref:hypothetical protein n=1 Tax=Oscillatoria sp. FACHB-1407 TaxID=2692847 RepID=UPI0016895449|nr:hypothetical protein [Oscillatoria sp. FACHB-1407]MBD2461549.1 hypothetical protein [Oscillatoria sp. FACHB-1407]